MGGLGAGLLLAALILGGSAVSRLTSRCESSSSAECAFERELAGEGARVEALAALGCLLVGAGLVLRLKRAPTSAPPAS
jgi:hypothetical protein